ncbi:nitroreductase family deazaflavin-dependent oxidoreductase [Planosporangium sp. 12N6]|uniref:nitroreductase family deazaflavin-dependent oxidoreductase n=1 Tax=Planosporangium spinosum TaxID=3402278 RepID=UPI003CE8ED0A
MTDFDHPIDPTESWQADHIQRYVATDGRDGHEWRPGVHTLLLTTRGRRSGKARRNALIYGRDGDRYVVVASKGGHPEHPDWYRNLTADPNVRVQVLGEKFDARARTATPEERARLWPEMARIFPPYEEYQKGTERQIPVAILEPTGGSADRS